MPNIPEKSFLAAWFRTPKARVRNDSNSARQYWILSSLLVALAFLIHSYLGSLLGTLAGLAAAILVTATATPGPLATRSLYALLLTVFWIPVGRALEFAGYGLASLLLFILFIVLIYVGGRRP
jgi:hypothetical protein